MDILQMSVSAAVLIIAVVILRALTLYKLPKRPVNPLIYFDLKI
jgi:hypothetical protein